jgi:hypothetical protein
MEWNKTECKKCPSCMQALDTCAHVLFCDHAGCVETLKHTIDLLEQWLSKGDTDPGLLDCIAEYPYGRGGRTMVDICQGLGEDFQKMVWEQDAIGWQQFMKGMISRRMRGIQSLHHLREVTHLSPKQWAQGLILKLLEATHGQWMYRKIHIHNSVVGMQANLRKEAIQWEIESQMELGTVGLLKEDHWMMEVNLRDMESTTGEQEEYWLVAIKAAWEAATLTWQRANQTQTEHFTDGP